MPFVSDIVPLRMCRRFIIRSVFAMIVAVICECSSGCHSVLVLRASYEEKFTAVVVRLCPIEDGNAPSARIVTYDPRYIVVLREGLDRPNSDNLDEGIQIFAVHDPSILFGTGWKHIVGNAYEFTLRHDLAKLPTLSVTKRVDTSFDWREFLRGEDNFF